MIKNKTHILLMLFSLILLGGCDDLLEIDPPQNETDASSIFNSDATAEAAVNGAYSSMASNSTFNLYLYAIPAMTADEMINVSTTNYNEYEANTLDARTSNNISDIWQGFYTTIYRANSVIEGLEGNTAVSEDLGKQLSAEARFLRAYCYFYLVSLWGDVPLVTMTDVNQSALLPRTSATEVYEQILADLEAAFDGLPEDYSSHEENRTRPIKWAAAAMLARVYLYLESWEDTENYASLVIENTGLYHLADLAGSSPFYANDPEAIWQFFSFGNPPTGRTFEGINLNSSTPQFVLQETLLSAFEEGDLRKVNWTDEVTDFSGETVYTKMVKYKNTFSVETGNMEQPTLLRLAEQYLIRAEARARQGNITAAGEDLNTVRLRAGLGEITSNSQDALLSAIARENQTEFFCELGHRWLDLKRTGRADEVLGVLKPAWQSYAVWYPIPQTAIDSNPNLIQNNGY